MYKPKSKIVCNNCGDVIFSKREGEYTTCKCGLYSIDETSHYCQMRGEGATTESLTEDDYRNFTWGSLNGKSTKIKDLTDDHLMNIVIHIESLPEDLKGYYYGLMLDEVKFRNLEIDMSKRRLEEVSNKKDRD